MTKKKDPAVEPVADQVAPDMAAEAEAEAPAEGEAGKLEVAGEAAAGTTEAASVTDLGADLEKVLAPLPEKTQQILAEEMCPEGFDDLPPEEQLAHVREVAARRAFKPESAHDAVLCMCSLNSADPESAARISWPDLFPADPDPAPAPKLDEAALRAGLTLIETGNSDLGRAGLIEALKAEGAELGGVEGAPAGWGILFHGIEASADSPKAALDRWCSKARRAVLSGEAA